MMDSVPGRVLFEESSSSKTTSLDTKNQSETNCDSCEQDGESKPAVGFCVECQHYLCDQCFQYHCLPRPMRHHRLLDKKEMPKKKVKGNLSEVCKKHEGEAMKFYCRTHEVVGCNSCMVIEHKPCLEICSLADIAKGVENSERYKNLYNEISFTKRELKDQIKISHENIEISKSCRGTAIASIDKFQEQMLKKLESLRNEITEEATEKERKDIIKMEQLEEMANKAKEDLHDLTTDMEILEETKQSKQLFIAMKKVGHLHQDLKKTLDNVKKENKVERCAFVANEFLFNMMQNVDALGELRTYETDAETLQSSFGNYLEYAFPKVLPISEEECIMTDRIFNRVYLVENNKKIAEKKLTSCPWDMELMEENEFAVTLPNEKKIKIMSVVDQEIKESKEIKVDARCEGIAYAENTLFLTCTKPPSVIVLDSSGKIIRTISTNENCCPLFKQPAYLAYNRQRKHICVTDRQTASVYVLTMEGKLENVYKLEKDQMPLSILVANKDEDGNMDQDEGKNESIVVVDFENNSALQFHIIGTGELELVRVVKTDSDFPFWHISDIKLSNSDEVWITASVASKK